jgi:hypothetical protein
MRGGMMPSKKKLRKRIKRLDKLLKQRTGYRDYWRHKYLSTHAQDELVNDCLPPADKTDNIETLKEEIRVLKASYKAVCYNCDLWEREFREAIEAMDANIFITVDGVAHSSNPPISGNVEWIEEMRKHNGIDFQTDIKKSKRSMETHSEWWKRTQQ